MTIQNVPLLLATRRAGALLPHSYVAVDERQSRRAVTFYARTPAEGNRLALAWGQRFNCRIYRQKGQ